MPIVLYPATIGIGQGATDGPVQGTGLSVPAGVEAIFEFNGLKMNNRRWWDTYLIEEIDGLDDADIRDSRELNPSYHGETAYDAYYGGRTITLSGKIRAYTLPKLRDLEQALRAAFNDLVEHPLIIRGVSPETDVMLLCRKYQKIVIKEAQTDYRYMRAFQISLRASYPFFLSNLENYAPLTLAGSTGSIQISNRGNFQSEPRLRIIGPITNPIVSNATNGKQMALTGTLAPAEVWEIDTRRRTIVDETGANKFAALSVTADWIDLEPFTNQIQLTGTGITIGATSLQVFWNDTWN